MNFDEILQSAEEGKVIQRTKKEMETVGFDKIEIEPMGNIMGYIGHGKHLVAILVYPTESYFPTWFIEEEHPVCSTLMSSYKNLFNKDALLDKWTFSTNGVSIMGKYVIPCIGFGPGHEEEAHAPNEKTWKSELVKCAALYAAIPLMYVKDYADKMP